jgi:hypothetical protein
MESIATFPDNQIWTSIYELTHIDFNCPTFNEKIKEIWRRLKHLTDTIYKENTKIWYVLMDYKWIMMTIIDGHDSIVRLWYLTSEEVIETIENFLIFVRKILTHSTKEVIYKLKDIDCLINWTKANIVSVQKAFDIYDENSAFLRLPD